MLVAPALALGSTRCGLRRVRPAPGAPGAGRCRVRIPGHTAPGLPVGVAVGNSSHSFGDGGTMYFEFAWFAYAMVLVLLYARFLLLCDELNRRVTRLRDEMQRLAEQNPRDVAALRSDLTRSR